MGTCMWSATLCTKTKEEVCVHVCTCTLCACAHVHCVHVHVHTVCMCRCTLCACAGAHCVHVHTVCICVYAGVHAGVSAHAVFSPKRGIPWDPPPPAFEHWVYVIYWVTIPLLKTYWSLDNTCPRLSMTDWFNMTLCIPCVCTLTVKCLSTLRKMVWPRNGCSQGHFLHGVSFHYLI